VECFPSDATVDVLDMGKVPLSSLQIGAQVRVVNDKNQVSYSPIIAFLHRDLDEHALYKRIRTKNSIIELSKRHLIHHRYNGFIWSEKLIQGDEILVVSSNYENETQWEEIIEITDVNKQGLMAPLTEQGTIIVNNVHASCYALVKSHQVAHFALAPYRFYHRLFGQLSDRNSMTTPILSYANMLLHFFKNLPIAKDLIF
jgi:hedgehog protein